MGGFRIRVSPDAHSTALKKRRTPGGQVPGSLVTTWLSRFFSAALVKKELHGVEGHGVPGPKGRIDGERGGLGGHRGQVRRGQVGRSNVG